ncbi:MAG: alpha-ketoglutarate-dependent dioxygenase AlkB [Gammaproteobacteria bacterium]
MTAPAGFTYRGDFLDAGRADALLETLWAEADWTQRDIVLFGRRVAQPRRVAWMSDPGVSYRYSGLTWPPTPWHAAVADLRKSLENALGRRFNSVLLNAYRDGRDSMGWHADDEPELGPEPCIASVSLGATRRLLVRPAAGGPSTGFDLEHGSLLVMEGRSQADYRHSVPKTRRPVGRRVNLTFRWIRPR